MTFLFIIPSYNSHGTIGRTVRSILAQTALERVKEIIIVDSSNDGLSRDVIRDFEHPLLRPVLLDKKTMPAAGRNIGARAAGGDVLCFIDSDVELAPDWVEIVAAAVEGGARVGGGSVAVAAEQRRNILSLGQFYLQFNEFTATGDRRIVPLLPSCSMFCERSLFHEVGGFPDLQASEDVMFCLNAGEKAPVWFVPRARCFHIFRREWGKFLSNQKLLGQYVLIYRRLYYRKWFYRGLWPLLFLPAFLGIKLARILARIVKAGPGHLRGFLVSLPVFTIGLFFWAWGFLLESIERSVTGATTRPETDN